MMKINSLRCQKNLKKCLTNKDEYDKIFELTYELAANLKRQNAYGGCSFKLQ